MTRLLAAISLVALLTTNVAFAEEAAPATKASFSKEWPGISLRPHLGWAMYMSNAGTTFNANLLNSIMGVRGAPGLDAKDFFPTRQSMLLALGIDFSGFLLEPYYAYETMKIGVGAFSDTKAIHAVGLGLGYIGHIKTLNGRLWPQVGFEVKWGYLIGTETTFAMELLSRIPIGLTYYPIQSLGINFELGLGYHTLEAFNDSSVFLIHGFYMDLAVGIRWP